MFKFLKEKIKQGIERLTRKIDKEAKEEVKEIEKTPQQLKAELKEEVKVIKEEIHELKEEAKSAEKVEEVKEKVEELKEEKEEIEKEIEEIKVIAAQATEKEAFPEEKTEEEPETRTEQKAEEKPELEKLPEELKLEEPLQEQKLEEPKKQGFFSRIFKKKEKEEPVPEFQPELQPEEEKEEKDEKEETAIVEEAPSGILGRIKHTLITKKINDKQFDEMFWELELALLENNVAVEVIEKIKQDLKANLVDKPILRGKVLSTITSTLRNTLNSILEIETINILDKIKQKKPYVMCFVGINGSGKTTTIAKVAQLLHNNKLKCVFAAADTFRAAAIHQLEEHGNNLKVKVIKHDYGADPAAVAFDAIKYAQAKNIDAVLIDTAGRMHSNTNLIDEMKKIMRVAKPDMKIFVGESITGNDCVEQAKKFNEAIEIDGIILSKADVDEKGGAALSVSYVTGKPILYIGTGQEYDDLEQFNPKTIIKNLGL